MKPKKPADWQKVREAYCNTSRPVRDICVHFAITGTSLYRHIKLENWPKRSDTERSGRNTKKLEKAPDLQKDDMISRLSGVFHKQLQDAESAANAPGASAAEREREGRALSVLWRNYEKLKEHEDMRISNDKKSNADEQAGWQSGEEERLCKEIHERLARMVQQQRADRASRKSENTGSEISQN